MSLATLLLIILTSIAITPLLLLLIDEAAAMAVYGWLLSDSVIAAYFTKTPLRAYHINPYEHRILTLQESMNYIAMQNNKLSLSKWYIRNVGRIPRWSKWSKVLDERHAELLTLDK